MSPRPDRGRLLIAEDSTINQRVALGLLEKIGLRADVVSNGVEALAALDRGSYAAVLMDCQMPEMDGLQATIEIRRREGVARHTWVIAMTANAQPGDRERCLAAGMDDLVSKPVRLHDLTAALDHCLGADSTQDPSPALARAEHPPANEPFDRTTLYALPSRSRDSLVRLFFEEATMRFERVAAAVATADAAAAHQAAHAFKGDAATVGAHEVAGLCRAIEKLAGAGQLEPCASLVAQLAQALARARSYAAK